VGREFCKKFIAEYSLAQWVQQLNTSLGIAPHFNMVAAEARKRSLMQRADVSSLKVRQQFLRRWRRRWRIKMGTISCREVLPEKEMQQKVGIVARFDCKDIIIWFVPIQLRILRCNLHPSSMFYRLVIHTTEGASKGGSIVAMD